MIPRPRSPGVEAVVVALAEDLPATELEEQGEPGPHLAAGGERAERDGDLAGPLDLERHLIPGFHGVEQLEALLQHHLLAAEGALEERGEVAAGAGRDQAVGELLL